MEKVFVTLSTDLGLRDAMVSRIKAGIMQQMPHAVVTDITHHITAAALKNGLYPLLASYRHFPAGAYHLVLANVFERTDMRLLLIKKDGHYFVVPDHEMAWILACNAAQCYEVHQFPVMASFEDWIGAAVQGINAHARRDAPLRPFVERNPGPAQAYKKFPGGIDCPILHTNRLGNVVLDITKEQFLDEIGQTGFRIPVSRRQEIAVVSNHYREAPENMPLCMFNAGGFLELALNGGSAARELGLEGCTATQYKYRSVRILKG